MIRIDYATTDLTRHLDPEMQLSIPWGNPRERDCRGCTDCTGGDNEVPGITCGGTTRIEDVRHGVSVCRDEDDLLDYLTEVQPDLNDVVLVELDGPESPDEPNDAHLGERLILPERIVAVRALPDELRDRLHARWDEMGL